MKGQKYHRVQKKRQGLRGKGREVVFFWTDKEFSGGGGPKTRPIGGEGGKVQEKIQNSQRLRQWSTGGHE